jgi:hypothetical protein
MRYSIVILSLILVSCKTAKVKDREYKVSSANTEIGSIGFSKSAIAQNDFTTRSFPRLENKLRVEVSVSPFNKKFNKIYQQKARFNQNQAKIQYIDSLETKPEVVTITILDIAGFVNEINGTNNKDIIDYLSNTEKAKVVTSIVTTLSTDNLSKIKQADTYYLVNNQDSKYVLALFKANKKMETIDLQSGVVLAYELSKFCWAMDSKGKWHLADLVDENSACKGKTEPKIKKKESVKSLYRM